MRRSILVAAGALALLAAGAVYALAGRAPDAARTPVTFSTSTAAGGAVATPGDARSINFADPALVAPVIQHFGGGEIPKERVTYADVTGDRNDEVIAIVESGGTMGDLGAAVFDVRDGKPHLLGYVDGVGKVSVTFGKDTQGLIDVKAGVFAPGDPLCCPTGLRESIFRWDGTKFAPITSQTLPNTPR